MPKMKRIIFYLSIVLILVGCSYLKDLGKNNHKNSGFVWDRLDNYKLEYLKPITKDWYLDKQGDEDFFVLNFVKRVPEKKEVSILITKSPEMNVEDVNVQQLAKGKIRNLAKVDEEFINKDFGLKSYVFKGKMPISNNGKNFLYSILSYGNGFEYYIVLSSYNQPVEKDEELGEILKSIVFYK